jgi:hypothetical protein
MANVILKAAVTQNGRPYVTNHGIEYFNLPAVGLDVMNKHGQKISDKVNKLGKGGKGEFAISLEAVVDGVSTPVASAKGVTHAQFIKLERDILVLQGKLIDESEKAYRKMGKIR